MRIMSYPSSAGYCIKASVLLLTLCLFCACEGLDHKNASSYQDKKTSSILMLSNPFVKSNGTDGGRLRGRSKLQHSIPFIKSTPRKHAFDFTHKYRQKRPRKNHNIASNLHKGGKPYYLGRALDFLREYGMHYGLFDQFFNHSISSIMAEKIAGDVVDGYNGTWHSATGLNASFASRDYSLLATGFDTTASLVNSSFAALNYSFVHPVQDVDILRFNNRFRYGDRINDRFMSIGFAVDPWLEVTDTNLHYLYFVGVETNLPHAEYRCDFYHPLKAQSKVEVEYHTVNAYDIETKNDIIRCALPADIVELFHNSEDISFIALNFTQHITLTSKPNGQEGLAQMTRKTVRNTLLADIRIYPSHPLDKRNFNLTLQTMVDNLEDPLLREWLVYNTLLGVEHFYIYYHTLTTLKSLELSKLRPFLDANIITVIYFPYHHTQHFNSIQHAGLNSHLRTFGGNSEWVGYWDVDEFYLPSKEMIYHYYRGRVADPCILCHLVSLLATSNTSAMVLNSMEMECPAEISDYNHYRGSVVSGEFVARKRVAVTTHCTREGFLFLESKKGHGKMLLRPSMVQDLSSPHRLNQQDVVWTTPENAGLIRHFNRFRYTAVLIARKHYKEEVSRKTHDLRDFTLFLLKNLVGVTFK